MCRANNPTITLHGTECATTSQIKVCAGDWLRPICTDAYVERGNWRRRVCKVPPCIRWRLDRIDSLFGMKFYPDIFPDKRFPNLHRFGLR